ncbi:MAG: 50S ribosomal protein L21, partial [Acidobacteria bacterium]|nr:50S ribosomal protein L21 [Acidobacteriota bacterium]
MYAVIQTGGRQLKVEPGAVVSVDHLAVPAGDAVVFDQVLFVADEGGQFASGTPLVAGARVVGVVDGAGQGPKIRVLRKKRRKAMR